MLGERLQVAGQCAIFLGPCLETLDDAMNAAAVAVTVIASDRRHALAAQANPQPNRDTTIGFVCGQRGDYSRNVLRVGVPPPADFLVTRCLGHHSSNFVPQCLTTEDQSVAEVLPRGPYHLAEHLINLPTILGLCRTPRPAEIA